MKEWDAESFRRGMHLVEDQCERYASEHSLKLWKGVASGRVSARDGAKGEALAANIIAGSPETDDRHRLLELLDELLTREIPATGIEDVNAYRRGFAARVRQTRAGIVPPPKAE